MSGCGDPKQLFLGSRAKDTCDVTWPVCDTVVGCVLGDSSYVSGRFPDKNARIGVRLIEPSEVKVSFFLEDITGAGEETAISFYEDRCRSRARVTVSGRGFVQEMQDNGVVWRAHELQGEGDHLIEVESDSRLSYLLKLDVTPLRLKETE